MALITASDVGLKLQGTQILHGVTFSLERGEIVTVVGPNGSGKSSLMRLLIGAETPTSGSVTRKPGLKIGYVPQRLALDRTLPIDVDGFLRLGGSYSTSERTAMLERVGVPNIARRQIASLSGGEFQRVMLAQALLSRPDVLALDEATQGLDQPGIARFYELIKEVRQDIGCAVLMISHDLHVVMSASDRVICLNGHICCEGAPTVVSDAPEYRKLFGVGTKGTLALYRHEHDHHHGHVHNHDHDHDHA